MSEIKIAIVGTGKIAELMCDAIAKTEGIRSVFVCSRSREKGRAFADKMEIEENGTFEEMLGNENIDAVYIATPNSLHTEQAESVLKTGKHVFLEKPASLTKTGVDLLYNTAMENNVFFIEAITTLFMPDFIAIKNHIESIGKIKGATVAFGRRSSKFDDYLRGDIPSNMSKPLGGGALNDMGIYCIHTAVSLFGKPENLNYDAEYDDNGVDLSGRLTLEYDGFICSINTAKNTDIDCGINILGEKGYLKSSGEVNVVPDAEVCIDGAVTDISEKQAENRMEYEVRAFRDAVLNHDRDFFEKMTVQTRLAAEILESAQS